MAYLRCITDSQQINSTLGGNFCVQPGVVHGPQSNSNTECDKHQDLILERQEVLLEKLLHRIETIEQSSTARQVRRLTARVERLERGIGVPRVEALENRVKDLEQALGNSLPEVVEEMARLVAAMAECKGAQDSLEQNVNTVTQGQATNVSNILSTLVTVAQQLADHNTHHSHHYGVLNAAFAGAAGNM